MTTARYRRNLFNLSSCRKTLLLAALSALLLGCGEKEEVPEPSAIEAAGKEMGQAVTRDLKEEIEQAKELERQAQQAAENLDKQIDEQTRDEQASEP